MPSAWWTVLTSAGVAALVSTGITFLNAHLERRARRNEVLLTKALDLAHEKVTVGMEVVRGSGRGAMLHRENLTAIGTEEAQGRESPRRR